MTGRKNRPGRRFYSIFGGMWNTPGVASSGGPVHRGSLAVAAASAPPLGRQTVITASTQPGCTRIKSITGQSILLPAERRAGETGRHGPASPTHHRIQAVIPGQSGGWNSLLHILHFIFQECDGFQQRAGDRQEIVHLLIGFSEFLLGGEAIDLLVH